jgi:uncharacterized protein YkwD
VNSTSASLTTASDTHSPEPRAVAKDEADTMAKCGEADARLDAVAAELAKRHVAGERDLSRTSELLRLAGEPHPWPRVWVGTGPEMSWSDIGPRVERWRSEIPTVGARRCGRALQNDVDGSTAIFVTVDALADLAPLPLRARTGSWLNVEAKLLVPAAEARVVVVGPDGRPRAVPTNMTNDGRVRATFAPDRPGRFAVQILADVGQGPRPLLEALVFADVAPTEEAPHAPGEAGANGGNDVEALARMVIALRSELGLPALRRDAELDALARAHATRMHAVGKVGHDVGDGDPRARFERAGLMVRKAGENVAHAETVMHAHRALYASPSHRENLIHRDFERFGAAVVAADDGTVWVAELFAQ